MKADGNMTIDARTPRAFILASILAPILAPILEAPGARLAAGISAPNQFLAGGGYG